jgi:hypothetical protein
MASALLAMGKGDLDLDTIDLRFIGVSSAYTWGAAHDMLNDVTNIITDAVAATGEAVAGVTGGFNLDCNDFTLTNVNGAVAGIYGYDHNGGADSARRLIPWYNVGSGLPTGTLSGGSVPVTVNASGVLAVTSSPS